MSGSRVIGRLVAGLAVVILAAGCGPSPSPSLSAMATPTAAPTPTPTATAEPSAAPTPTPIPTRLPFDPASATWTRLGSVPAVDAIVGFAGGYAATEGGSGSKPPVAWFSADGTTWSSTPLASLVLNCPNSGPDGDDLTPDATSRAIATNGREVVIFGEVGDYAGTPCGAARPIAWHSADGRTWQRSEPFPGEGQDFAEAVWAVPGGWQATSEEGQMWQSADALVWQQIDEPPEGMDDPAAAPDGTLLTLHPGPTLLTSNDGLAWTTVDAPEGCLGVSQFVGPDPCWSKDLVGSLAVTVAVWVDGVVQTRFGAIAYGDACFGAGATCKPDPRAWFLTEEGTWLPMAHPPTPTRYWGNQMAADGPAGVLLIGHTEDQPEGIAWRLDP